jgi:acetamidase/formamidase
MTHHNLAAERLHFAWDNSIAPVLEIDSGDSVTVETWDAGGHFIKPTFTVEDVRKPRPPSPAGHALTGPIFVTGAQPGDTLAVDVLEVAPNTWGYTCFFPGRGLLPDDFPSAYIRIWDMTDREFAQGMPGARVPLGPFCGVMGVALAESGSHSTIPPRQVGGNMDVRQLTAGSTLYLPVEVPGALFSVGDAHGVQGDGEVCITAVEMDSTTRLRISLVRDMPIREPQLLTSVPPTTIGGRYHGCTSHSPDLLEASRNATRYTIDWLCRTAGVTPEDAYILASVAAELRISQVVDAPNWTVTSFFPLSVLTAT